MSRRLRAVKIDGNKVEKGKPYILLATAVEVPLKPGEVPEVGKPRPVQMNMSPARLEWYDEESGATEEVMIEETPRIVVPK